MGKWSEAQRKYARSEKGKIARKKYQSSEKAKEARKRYMLKRRVRLTEAKQIKEINPVKNKVEVGKIGKEAVIKK